MGFQPEDILDLVTFTQNDLPDQTIEYAMDHIFGFNMQKSGLDDTMQDLIVDLAASLVVGALGYLYLKTHRDGLIRRVLLHVENRAAQARKARASADS